MQDCFLPFVQHLYKWKHHIIFSGSPKNSLKAFS